MLRILASNIYIVSHTLSLSPSRSPFLRFSFITNNVASCIDLLMSCTFKPNQMKGNELRRIMAKKINTPSASIFVASIKILLTLAFTQNDVISVESIYKVVKRKSKNYTLKFNSMTLFTAKNSLRLNLYLVWLFLSSALHNRFRKKILIDKTK